MKKLVLSIVCMAGITIQAQEDPTGVLVDSVKVITGTLTNNSEVELIQQGAGTFNVLPTTSEPTGTSKEVGITEGQLNVSLTGAATYSISIAVSPGINGVVPQIGLAYSSQSGNGLAGFGWNITGVSSITRIPATQFHDGLIDAVDFDNLDRFALDGQRLIVKQGTNGIYGANGTVYETENFSNVKITSYGVHPSGTNYGPEYFKVEYPDGSFAIYGGSNSRSIMEYSISYWQNPQGLRIYYTYILHENTLRISAIKYGSRTNTTPINEIIFNYNLRKREEQAYVGGQNIRSAYVLKSINVLGNGVGYRNYYLEHNITSLNYERLIKITEKNGDNTKSLNPTVFGYEETNNTIEYNSSSISGVDISDMSLLNTASLAGDYDGNGIMDIILYKTKDENEKKGFYLIDDLAATQSNVGFYVPTDTFEELFTSTTIKSDNILRSKNFITNVVINPTDKSKVKFNTYEYNSAFYLYRSKYFTIPNFSDPESNTYKSGTEMKYLCGDFNADGISDILMLKHKDIIVTKGSGGGFLSSLSSTTKVISADKSVYLLNLDARLQEDYTAHIGYLNDLLTMESSFFVGDVNGDGKSDIIIIESGKILVYHLNKSNKLELLFRYTDTSINIGAKRVVLQGDYNGDGKTDFLIAKDKRSSYWYKFSSSGTSFVKEFKNHGGLYFNHSTLNSFFHYIPADYNNDGKTDMLYINSLRNEFSGEVSVTCLVNKNGIFNYNDNSNYSIKLNSYQIQATMIPVFYTSNHKSKKTELAFIGASRLYYLRSQKDFSKEILLKEITTGNGAKQNIHYKPLEKEFVYQSYSNKNISVYWNADIAKKYPYTDITIAPSFNVVYKLEKISDKSYLKQLYTYHGGTANTQGIGFIGFQSTMKTNWFEKDTDPIFSSISRYDVMNRGLNTLNYTVEGLVEPNAFFNHESEYVSKTINQYNTYDNGETIEPFLLPNKVFKVKNTVTKSYNGLDNTSSETTILYDTYNNPTESTTIIKNSNTVEQTTKTIIGYDNQPSGTTYYVGRPISKKNTTTLSSTQEVTTSEELYGYTKHLLSSIKKKGHNTDFITESNGYDLYGNIIQKTITAPNENTPRLTKYKYDPTTFRFLIESTDIEGLITHYDYDLNNGLLKSETNPYNLKTMYEYDTWGKKIKTTDYLGKTSSTTYTRSIEKSTITTLSDDGSATYSLHNDIGLVIKDGYKNINDKWVLTQYEYDAYGRKVKVSEPYTSAEPTQWNTLRYDKYGRLLISNSYTGKYESINYDGLTTKTTDGTKTKTTLKNALGQIISVTDAPMGGTINYTYYANGNLKTTNYDGTITTIEQDGWGRKTKLTDPSAGVYEYTYNGFGETLTEKTPKGITTYKLDNFGKTTEKTIVGDLTNSKTTFEYHSETKLLQKTTHQDILNGSTTTYNYGYDGYKRLNFTDESNGYAYFKRATEFDEFGRPELELYSAVNPADNKRSDKWIRNSYKLGHHWQMIDQASNKVLWETKTTNARGQLVTASMNNGNETITNTYDTFGYIYRTTHNRVNVNPGNIMTFTTVFDEKRSNLKSRTNSLFAQTDNFKYDNLDRLTEFTNGFGVPETQTYDDQGRITTNSLGTYKYDNTNKPYQQTELETNPYATHYYENRSSVFFDSLEGNKEYFDAPVSDGYNITAPVRYELRTQYTGGASLKLRGNTSIKSRKAIRINNNQPTQYTYSVWTRGANTKGQISLLMKTANETQEYTYKDSANTTGDLFSWTKTERTVTIPADVKEIYIELKNTYTFNYDIYFDDLKLVKTEIANAPLELNITYNAFKSPVEVEEPAIDKYSFLYNVNNDRSSMFYGGLQDDKHQRPLQKHYSADGSMEIKRNTQTGEVEFITYIGGDAYSAPLVLKSDGTTQEYLFLHRDYQGSILAITNEQGTVIEKRQFDAWGQLVKVQDQYGNVLDKMTVLDRGYTGHEHLQSIGIIHMNGRLYDAKLHRFLQPDNFVQDPYNTQNFNRYGYCWNNPLKYTDPSGEFFWMAPLIYAAVNVAVDLAVNNGKMNFGQIAMSAGMGALSGALGGATTSATAFAGAMIGQMNRFLPAIPIYQSKNFSLNVSPFIGYGTSGFSSGLNANINGQVGDFVYAASAGMGINEGVSSLGESIGSSNFWNVGGFAGYNDGHANYGIGYSYNSFGGKMGQGVGSANIQVGDFGFSFINDILGDNGDRGRTAGVQMSYKVNEDITLVGGLSMMTGEENGSEPGGNPRIKKGMYTEGKMPYLRSGVLYGGAVYKGQANFYGHNSERRLHNIQNRVHRNWPIYDSAYFPDRGLRSKPYTYSGSYHSNYLYF